MDNITYKSAYSAKGHNMTRLEFYIGIIALAAIADVIINALIG
jgi:hypothetical protein